MKNKLTNIIKNINIQCEIIGNSDINIKNISNDISNKEIETVLWLSDKNIKKIENISNGIIICSELVKELKFDKELTILIVNNPRLVFSKILKYLFTEEKRHKISIKLDKGVKLGKNVNIERGTIIESGVTIGDNTDIGYNNVIHRNTFIGNNVKIGSNNTIGSIGFGYEKSEDGEYELIQHIGNVIIEDKVEIGNNNCIDRAVLGSTILKRNCKIDNLVHISHGVEIGENSLIIANSMIAGSVKIGDNTWISPSTSIINKSTIGSNSMTGIGSVVIKSIPDNELHVGVPSKKIKDI
jgi:UDP-3-O-[3-hydroxymyristoyl] glucosamine N-acyltransferase